MLDLKFNLNFFTTLVLLGFAINSWAQDSLSAINPKQEINKIINGEEEKYNRGQDINVRLLTSAINNASSLDYTVGEKNANYLLYEYFKSLNDFEKATRYHRQYLVLKDKLFNKNLENLKREFSTKYDPQKKEAEINVLKSKNEIDALNLSRKRWILLSSLSGLFFLVIIIFLVFRQYKTRQYSRILLSEQNEKFNKVNEQLKSLNSELEMSEHEQRRLNQTKDHFFSLISEELRSPLSSLSELLGVLINEAHSFSKSQVHELAVKINDAVNSLLELIENLLQWSRIQMEQIAFEEQDVLLNEIIDESIQLLHSQTESKNIQIDRPETSNFKVRGDRNMIHFMIRNLILNNIKFSPEAGEIKIEVKENTSTLDLIVMVDSQIQEFTEIQKLWESDQNIGELMIRDEKTSLGLMITRYFANQNKGAVKIEQKKNNSQFILSLPKA